MKGKWASGIPPRNFTWVIEGKLAMSERPGGFAPNHRKVRRQEEIIWLQVQGFNRVVSLLPSSHNLQAYDELSMASVHYPVPVSGDVRAVLVDLYRDLQVRLANGERLLIHQEELGDRVTGVVAGYLLCTDVRVGTAQQAVTVLENLTRHPMGAAGRELVTQAAQILAATKARSDEVSEPPEPARKASARKAPAKKVAGTKTPAKKVAGTKTPAKKVAATKAPAKKVAAGEAPATGPTKSKPRSA